MPGSPLTTLLRQRPIRIGIDVALLIGFGAEFITREGPDYAVHSWIGIVLVPIVTLHLATNWRWVTSTVARKSTHPDWNLALLNAALMTVTSICIVTGFPIWLEWSTNAMWSTVHNLTGFVTIVLALAHLWRNRGRLNALLGRRRASNAGGAPV